ncbi:Crp/Fnr family transcriptional regulator [Chryseobacterium sp. 09-1422]|uniref:Crp/Fnr family transcriptional regulator n=1 Tax=Chryseobacterium kimseyorum TaxID=2984028 RepID=A0ABT3HYG7_9FLAO|nr:Crp/Fnr family transcriptional regulator [Chryseobacterium kimseyorum]MCW3168804.1 Crp/Fnr family transcriptional regulator [Chryseobacterium kimseyorum]
MLRTNQSFLAYVHELYDQQKRKEDITVKYFEKDELILSQDEEVNKVMLIKEGIVKCSLTEENGKEYILEFSGSGEIVGELENIRQVKALCSIEALTTVSVFSISRPYFNRLLEEDIKFNRFLIDVFAERIFNTSSRASYQQLYTVEESLNRLLELQAHQDIAISKENMAAYLGVSVRSLNRSLKSLLNKNE